MHCSRDAESFANLCVADARAAEFNNSFWLFHQQIHLTDVGMAMELVNAPDEELNPIELEYKKKAIEWQRKEGAYINLNSTKPQTLAFSLSDSPVGMAAYIVEKYHSWSDWELLTMDDLCDCLTLYWLTNTAGTTLRAYHGNTFTLPPLGKVTAPTAIAAFPCDVLPVPREWIERNYSVCMYTDFLESMMPWSQEYREYEEKTRQIAMNSFKNLFREPVKPRAPLRRKQGTASRQDQLDNTA